MFIASNPQVEALSLPQSREEAASMFTNWGLTLCAMTSPYSTEELMKRITVQNSDMTASSMDSTTSSSPIMRLFGRLANFFRCVEAGSVVRGPNDPQEKRHILYGVWYVTMILNLVWADLTDPKYFLTHPTAADIIDHLIEKTVKNLCKTHTYNEWFLTNEAQLSQMIPLPNDSMRMDIAKAEALLQIPGPTGQPSNKRKQHKQKVRQDNKKTKQVQAQSSVASLAPASATATQNKPPRTIPTKESLGGELCYTNAAHVFCPENFPSGCKRTNPPCPFSNTHLTSVQATPTAFLLQLPDLLTKFKSQNKENLLAKIREEYEGRGDK